MREIDFNVKSPSDGLTLAATLYLPAGKPEALVQIAHGMAEHRQRYAVFAEYLADEGFAVLINDMRGHGESIISERDLGYFNNTGYDGILRDLGTVYDEAVSRVGGGLPYVVMGHSMGALVACLYGRRNDTKLSALVLSGIPTAYKAAGGGMTLDKIIKALRGERNRPRMLDKIAFGSYSKKFGGKYGDFTWLTRDTAIVNRYINDPRCGFVFTCEGFATLFSLLTEVYTGRGRADNKTLPVRFFSGGDDPCMGVRENLTAAADMMRERGYNNVGIKIYDGMRHEILNEEGRGEVMSNIAEFIHAAVK